MTHTSLYPVLLLPPLLMLLAEDQVPTARRLRGHLFVYLASFLSLVFVNWTLTGWAWIPQSWGVMYVSVE